MPDSSTQPTVSLPQYSSKNSSDSNYWNDEVSSTNTENIVENGTTISWHEQTLAPVIEPTSNISHNFHVPSTISGINTYNPPNYVHLPYQRNMVHPSNTYIAMNGSRLDPHNIINTNGHIRIGNSIMNSTRAWSNQPANIGRYISQPAWGASGHKTTNGGIKKQKRIRTAFTSSQMMELEQEYTRSRYLDRARRLELAENLRLNERTIKIWFQNRRMKEKKDRAENLEEMEEASSTSPPPGVGPMPMVMQEEYQTPLTNEVYHRDGMFIEQYPVTNVPFTMPVTSVTTTVPQMERAYHELGNCPEYISEDLCQAPYQHVHLQLQHYPSPYSAEIQELSSETSVKNDIPPASAPNDIIEKSWDLSWIKSLHTEEDY